MGPVIAPHRPEKWSSSAREIAGRGGLVVLLIALASLLVAHLVGEGQAKAQRDANTLTRNLVLVLGDTLSGTLSQLDLLLSSTAYEIERQEAGGGIDTRTLNAFLDHQQALVAPIISLRATDPAGDIRYGAGLGGVPVNISDRVHFTRQRDLANEMVVGAPLLGRLDKRWILPVSRRVALPDGSFGGVTTANIPTDYLTKVFSAVDIGRQGAIDLFDGERNILGRYPEPKGPASAVGIKIGSPEFQALFAAAHTEDTYQATSTTDGIRRTYSYRKLGHFPLFIMVGMAEDEYLAGWRVQRTWILVLYGIFVATVMGVSVLMFAARRRQIEAVAALADSEARLRLFISGIKDYALIMLDPQGRVATWDEGARRLKGYEESEILGKSMQCFFSPEDVSSGKPSRLLAEATANEMVEDEGWRVRKDGSQFYAEVLISALHDEAGGLVGFAKITRDITERKEAEKQMRFRALLLDSVSDSIFVTDLGSNLIYANEAAWQRRGYTREELLAMRIQELDTPDFARNIGPRIAEMVRTGGSITFESAHRCKDGTIMPIEVVARLAEVGSRNTVLATARDITDRKQAEAARQKVEAELRSTAARLNLVLKTAAEGIIGLDDERRVMFANPAAAAILGWPSSEAIQGKSSQEVTGHILADGSPCDELTCQIRKNINGRETVRVMDEFFTKLDGKVIPVEYVVSPLIVSDVIVGTVVAFHDIIDRKALETELKRSNAELEQFAYVASHDLRSPLRAIGSYLNLIARGLGSNLAPELEEFLGFAIGGAKRMDALIVGLLDYSRTGRKRPIFEPVPLAEAVADSLLGLVVQIEDAKASVTVAEGMPTVMGDRMELVRLFQNLIGNALKYCSPQRVPKVSIDCQARSPEWVVAVRDNGIGIAPVDYERCFGIFQRLVSQEQYEGTGIGLAVCKKIVEHHGGQIWIESVPGEGSNFFFTLCDNVPLP